MIRIVLVGLIVLLGVLPVSAQDDCAMNMRCQSVPWALPIPPALSSPTIAPTQQIVFTPVPEPTQTPLPSATPITPIPTTGINATNVADQIQTLQAMLTATPLAMPTQAGDLTPLELSGNAGVFFGYFRGLADGNFGKFSELVNFFFLATIFIMSLTLLLAIVPILSGLIGFFRKLIQLILDFIPG